MLEEELLPSRYRTYPLSRSTYAQPRKLYPTSGHLIIIQLKVRAAYTRIVSTRKVGTIPEDLYMLANSRGEITQGPTDWDLQPCLSPLQVLLTFVLALISADRTDPLIFSSQCTICHCGLLMRFSRHCWFQLGFPTAQFLP